MTDRAEFLNTIRARLREYRPTRAPDVPWTPGTAHAMPFSSSAEDLPNLFLEQLGLVGSRGERVPSLDEARERILLLARERGAQRLIRWDGGILDELRVDAPLEAHGVAVTRWRAADDLRDNLATADIGLGRAEYGVAETGSLVLPAGFGQGRTISLLPPLFIAIVPVDRVVHRLRDVIDAYAGDRELPSGLCIVTGPSRSGDIEQSQTIGVHGPGAVHVLLIG